MKNAAGGSGPWRLGLVVGTTTLIGFTPASAIALNGAHGEPLAAVPCTTPECIRGVPPTAPAFTLLECTNEKCLPGTEPVVRPWRSPRVAELSRDGVSTVAARVSRDVGTIGPINCPPPNPTLTASISDC
jgi:hypothetical protein